MGKTLLLICTAKKMKQTNILQNPMELRRAITSQMKNLSSYILEKVAMVLATEMDFLEECLFREILRNTTHLPETVDEITTNAFDKYGEGKSMLGESILLKCD